MLVCANTSERVSVENVVEEDEGEEGEGTSLNCAARGAPKSTQINEDKERLLLIGLM